LKMAIKSCAYLYMPSPIDFILNDPANWQHVSQT
jgi:hypothetical protein